MNRTLVGDLGGTNTRFAISIKDQDDLENIRQFKNADFATFDDVLTHYLTEIGSPSVEGVCIAAAGPVADGELRMTNIDWTLSEAALRKRLDVDVALLINDLPAFAYSLELLGVDDLTPVYNAKVPLNAIGQKLVVNLGTGFNVSVTARSPRGTIVALKSEMGHAAMPGPIWAALESDLSQDVVRELKTFEHLFAGRGFEWLYRNVAGADAAPLTGQAIAYGATSDQPDETCVRVASIYARMMGLMCADMIKIYLPTGGVYFSGSVASLLKHPKYAEIFAQSLESAPNLPNLPKHIYFALISDGFAALKGCSVLIDAET